MSGKKPKGQLPKALLDEIERQLSQRGIDLDQVMAGEQQARDRVKVVCVAADLRESVDELASAKRGNVVMVRIDETTLKSLDAWVETGAVKSRSEAAALFIQEGLKVRETELKNLDKALRDVERAKARLRSLARGAIGATGEGPGKETNE